MKKAEQSATRPLFPQFSKPGVTRMYEWIQAHPYLAATVVLLWMITIAVTGFCILVGVGGE